MKRILAFGLAMVLVLSLCACGGQKESCVGEHSWGDWEAIKESTDFTPGQSQRACQTCGETEVKENFHRMFSHYAEIIRWLPFFTEAERLQQNLDSVISAAFFGGVAHETQMNEEEGVYYHTVKVSDLNDFTRKVFGCVYDYTGVENLWVLYESKASYDAQQDAVVIRAMGAGDETPQLQDVIYEINGAAYMVTAVYAFYDETWELRFCVVEKDGNYVISTY